MAYPLPESSGFTRPSAEPHGRPRTLILSAFPLTREMKERCAEGSNPSFLDLASLRSRGTLNALRFLRSCGADDVMVTGNGADLPAFRDLLILAAGMVPHARRVCWAPPAEPARLRWMDYAGACIRIALGIAIGVTALARARLALAGLSSRRDLKVLPLTGTGRCLYLKPALNLGMPVGGAVGHVAGVTNALVRRGEQVCLLAVAGQPLVSPEIDQVTIPQGRYTAYPNELNLFSYGRKYLRRARAEAENFRPDYVYQRYSVNDTTGIILRRRLGVPLILEFNGSETWIQKNWGQALRFQGLSEKIEATNLRHADLVVVVSQEVKRQVLSLGIPPERVLFYPNGVDRSLFDPDRFDADSARSVRAELGVPPDADLFTFVGTFGRWHGTEVLASAIRQLIDRNRRYLEEHRIHFLFVGDGPQGTAVRSILGNDLGRPFVTLAGYRPQEETPAILAASDACLAPHVPNADGSPFFGSPTKLFEYMAMAKPIIASDLAQIGWVLRGWSPGSPAPDPATQTESAAVLVQPGSLASLTEGILKVTAMDDAARDSLGHRAQSLVDAFFTWDKNVDAVMRAFRDRR